MSAPTPDRPNVGDPAPADISDHLREIAAILASQGFRVAAANVREAEAEIGRLRSMLADGDARLRALLLAADVSDEEAVARLRALRGNAACAAAWETDVPGDGASTAR